MKVNMLSSAHLKKKFNIKFWIGPWHFIKLKTNLNRSNSKEKLLLIKSSSIRSEIIKLTSTNRKKPSWETILNLIMFRLIILICQTYKIVICLQLPTLLIKLAYLFRFLLKSKRLRQIHLRFKILKLYFTWNFQKVPVLKITQEILLLKQDRRTISFWWLAKIVSKIVKINHQIGSFWEKIS